MIEVRSPVGVSNAAPLRVAHELTSGLHPVTSPAVSRSGMIYATISGPRGKQTPVSVVRVSPDGRGNAVCDRDTQRHRLGLQSRRRSFCDFARRGQCLPRRWSGRIDAILPKAWAWPRARPSIAEGNLFVGDRSGTIFKIDPQRKIFVHATLEPSVSAYHLAVDAAGTLFVTGPTLCSNDAIWAIDTHGEIARLVSRSGTAAGAGALEGR